MKKVIWTLIFCQFIFISSVCYGDEADIFTSMVEPDATIILDLSASMSWTAWGPNLYVPTGTDCHYDGPFYPTQNSSHSALCYFDADSGVDAAMSCNGSPQYGDATCQGPFYRTSGTGHTTNCSRLAIDQAAIFELLDYNGDNTINSSDRTGMKVRMAYMADSNCQGWAPASEEFSDTFNYNTGCNRIWKTLDSPNPGSYSSIYCNNSTQCQQTTTCSDPTQCVNYGTRGTISTAIVSSLAEVKLYNDYTKSIDTAAACRQKFVILLTDAGETTACLNKPGSYVGWAWDFHPQQYVRRKEAIARAKALHDAGYTLFVISMGNALRQFEQNTLEWMAYFGGSDNPMQSNTGDPTKITPPVAGSCTFDTGETNSPPSCPYPVPTGYTGGNVNPGSNTVCIDYPTYTASGTKTSCHPSVCGGNTNDYCFCYEKTNDPGNFFDTPLSGYAFFANDPTSLATALQQAFAIIEQSIYSFSVTSVAAARTSAENYIYEAAFKPVNNTPLWLGHLTKSSLNSDGTVGNQVWDAGSVLQSAGYSTRNISTYVPYYTGMGSFTNLPVTTACNYLGVSCASSGAAATPIIGYIQGNPTYNPDNWKLGDIFHSNPTIIGSPSSYFIDTRDTNNAFSTFRTNNPRTSASGSLLAVAGANDGQFHAFVGLDGSEKWSFIPPNILPKLRFIAHSALPTTLSHKYLVDGPATVADVWLGTGTGTSKSVSDWHTLLVFGEGKGVRDQTGNATPPAQPWNSSQACTGSSNATYNATNYPYYCGAYAWSSSSYCDTSFNNTYTGTYQYYCGYYALDVTNTGATTPTFKWRLNPNSTQAPYLGEPWSKMAIGRVLIGGSEQWVGFIGAGYPMDTGNTGRAFFVVSLTDGSILWSYTKANNSSMTYGIPASPAVVDTDNDGFIDTAYVGDLGGNMWRFKFCAKADGTGCGTGNWSGGLLFNAQSSGRPIYTAATIARDTSSIWVLWGTGERENPTATSGQDSFFAVKDSDRTTTYTSGNLQDVSASGVIYNNTSSGWLIKLGNGTGEKDLADPTVYGGITLFTTYTPDTSDTNPCKRVGSSNLYAISMMPITINGIAYAAGAGVLTPGSAGTNTGGAKSVSLATLGTGLAKSPVVSQNYLPGSATNVYITLSGGADQNTDIITTAQLSGSVPLNTRLQTTGITTQVLHWRDGRMQ